MIYIPDIPAQMIDNNKKESHAVQISSANEMDVLTETRNGEGVGKRNAEYKIASEESKIKSKEK